MIGNSFHCVVVALLLGSAMVTVGYLKRLPRLKELWTRSGLFELKESASVPAKASSVQQPSPAPPCTRHGTVREDVPVAETNAVLSSKANTDPDGVNSRVGEIPEEFFAHIDE